MTNLWFDGWESILRIICIAPVAYFALVFILKFSGKRTLAKMNAFDFVVTIALGSILASVVLNQNIPLANGVATILLFIGFQFILTWLAVRVKKVKTLITSKPSLLFYKGNFLHQAMKEERITVEEIYSAVRRKGISSLDKIDAIILETTGDMAIIEKITTLEERIFEDVKIKPLN